ncbi:MAG: hypothetical protein ABI990_06295 [Actinomycetota bacterium]
MLKRVAAFAAFLVALFLIAGPAWAGLGGPPSVFTVSFVGGAGLSNATCPLVPAGTTISWTGPETATFIARTDANGVTTVSSVSHASGKATDNYGNTYAFNYSNAFRVSNSVGDPGTFTGTMTDTFSLAGQALHLSNGFIASFTTNFSDVFVFDPINSRGDPIDFADGSTHCDPL